MALGQNKRLMPGGDFLLAPCWRLPGPGRPTIRALQSIAHYLDPTSSALLLVVLVEECRQSCLHTWSLIGRSFTHFPRHKNCFAPPSAKLRTRLSPHSDEPLNGHQLRGCHRFRGHKELLAMKDRKGIARLALRTGMPIMPAYSFGNTTAAGELNGP